MRNGSFVLWGVRGVSPNRETEKMELGEEGKNEGVSDE